jgi:hypothetical protein
MKQKIKSYELTVYRYIFNVYNASNYKTPKKISVVAPMLEIALEKVKNKNPSYCVDFLDIA